MPDATTVTGLNEFRADRLALPGVAAAKLRELARVTASGLKAEIAPHIPRSPGPDHHVEVLVTEDRSAQTFTVFDRVKNPKAANLTLWLEFGTIHMAPRPVWFPAINRAKAAYARLMDSALQSAFDATVNR